MRTLVQRPSSRLLLTALVALALVGMLVIRTSQAAFTANHTSENNRFSTVGISLHGSPTGVLFEVDNMVPGGTEQRCIRVTYEGQDVLGNPSLGDVKVYVGNYSMGDSWGEGVNLDNYLELEVREGDSGTNCSGATSVLQAQTPLRTVRDESGDYNDGLGNWRPTNEGWRDYQLTVTLRSDTPNEAMGAEVTGVPFVWEIQTTS